MLNDKQKEILHHRWLVFGIIAAIIITLLDLWEFLLYIVGCFLICYFMLWLFFRICYWLSGEDMRNPSKGVHDDPDESDHDSVSDTLWDIETLHALQHHNDDYAHYHDYLNDDDDHDNNDDLY